MPRANEARPWREIVADVGHRIAPWARPRGDDGQESGAVADALAGRPIRRR